jgi:hypothetical protein
VRSSRKTLWQRLRYFLEMEFKNFAGLIIFSRGMDTETVKWSNYRSDMVDNSDFRKFDGMLRMVMDGKQAQAEALRIFLESEYQQGRLVYGMHKSREALLTCIVQRTMVTTCTLSMAAMVDMRWRHEN